MIKRAILGLLVFSLAACAVRDRISSVNNSFLGDIDTSRKLENLPFDHSAAYNNVDRSAYSAVSIKPVRVDTLPKDGWEKSISYAITSEQDFKATAEEVAAYLHDQLASEVRKTSGFDVVNGRGSGVAVIEIALTELEFSHPAATAATYASPIPGTGVALSSMTEPHAAMAIRITDGEDGKLLATIADRKFPPTRIVDLNKFTVTSSVREICQNWAIELAEALQKGRFGTVEERGTIRLKPW